MPDDARRGPANRRTGRPRGGRRATDPIDKLETHRAAFVSLGQLVDYWAIHVRTLQRFVESGELIAYRFGAEYRIKREDAIRFEQTKLYVKRTAS